MIFLRLLSFLISITIPMAPALLLGDVSTRGMPGWSVLGGLFGMSLISGSFLYIALLAPRMRRSIALRVLGGILLVLPMAASFALMWARPVEKMLWCGGLLLAASVLMFISFVFPAIPDGRQRPMRKPDSEEPALS
jgi:uncharacterized membrane protein YdcZ (DUF606 family)